MLEEQGYTCHYVHILPALSSIHSSVPTECHITIPNPARVRIKERLRSLTYDMNLFYLWERNNSPNPFP